MAEGEKGGLARHEGGREIENGSGHESAAISNPPHDGPGSIGSVRLLPNLDGMAHRSVREHHLYSVLGSHIDALFRAHGSLARDIRVFKGSCGSRDQPSGICLVTLKSKALGEPPTGPYWATLYTSETKEGETRQRFNRLSEPLTSALIRKYSHTDTISPWYEEWSRIRGHLHRANVILAETKRNLRLSLKTFRVPPAAGTVPASSRRASARPPLHGNASQILLLAAPLIGAIVHLEDRLWSIAEEFHADPPTYDLFLRFLPATTSGRAHVVWEDALDPTPIYVNKPFLRKRGISRASHSKILSYGSRVRATSHVLRACSARFDENIERIEEGLAEAKRERRAAHARPHVLPGEMPIDPEGPPPDLDPSLADGDDVDAVL